jgi:hypothetical protein
MYFSSRGRARRGAASTKRVCTRVAHPKQDGSTAAGIRRADRGGADGVRIYGGRDREVEAGKGGLTAGVGAPPAVSCQVYAHDKSPARAPGFYLLEELSPWRASARRTCSSRRHGGHCPWCASYSQSRQALRSEPRSASRTSPTQCRDRDRGTRSWRSNFR